MQARTGSEANIKSGPNLDPGTYEATLEKVTAWTTNKYQSTEIQPCFTLTWNLGEDEKGESIRKLDTFINVPCDGDGYPFLDKRSKLYNRLAALFGEAFDIDATTWGFQLPSEWDSDDPSVLLELPHTSEAKKEGFKPLELDSLNVAGVELLGKTAQITLAKKGEYLNVESATPLPKRRLGGQRPTPAAPAPAPASQRANRSPAPTERPGSEDSGDPVDDLPFDDGQEAPPPPAPPARSQRAGNRF